MRNILITTAIATLTIAAPFHGAAMADEVTLRAVGAFPTGSAFDKPFQEFISWVNENGKGVVQINYVGGPEAIPSLEVGNAVSNGVIDVAGTPVSFYTSQFPGASILKLATNTMPEQRANGCFDKIDEMHQDRMNVKYLGRTGDHVSFHLYLNKPIDKPDLSGLNIRVAATYQAMFGALNANMVSTPPNEVYSALERGTVDGYGWPSIGIFDLGWQEYTKYRVDPGFYVVEVNFLANLDRWNTLDNEQRGLLEQGMLYVEDKAKENIALVESELKRQEEQGIEVINFEGEDRKTWMDTATQAGLQEVIDADAEAADKLSGCLITN
tara:strand:- start:788 stop:1762 length:975 start_codon:yes stop_codon:yes gene_type:complete